MITKEEEQKNKKLNSQLNEAVKIYSKEYGFQKTGNYIYRFEGNFIYWIRYFLSDKLVANILMKPIELNHVFWDVFGLPELKRKPKSFHVSGRFSTKFVNLGVLSFEYSDEISDVFIKCLSNSRKFIKDNATKINNLEKFSRLVEHDSNQTLNYILLQIYFKKYKLAYEIVSKELLKGEVGGFIGEDGKSIYEKIKIYCEQRV